MPAINAFMRGHQEVGFVVGAVDSPVGKTAPEAVQLQMEVTTVDLESSQSKMHEDTGITLVGMSLVINGIDAALRNIQRLFGMPDSAFSGDLAAGTPTNEVLQFREADLGESERHLYSLGPGALGSQRRIDAPRTKLASVGALVQAKSGWMLPTATWRVLSPGAGAPVLTITDALGP